MRFLKNKIFLASQRKNSECSTILSPLSSQASSDIFSSASQDAPPQKQRSRKSASQAKNTRGRPISEAKATKTVVKNYGKAIASFSTSEIAEPYLLPLINHEECNYDDFIKYISIAKESIEGIDTLRGLLLVRPEDDPTKAAYKRVFQGIAEIFIKYFSVNWIFSGRMMNKKAHLNLRHKMLRRVQHPELFTYLK